MSNVWQPEKPAANAHETRRRPNERDCRVSIMLFFFTGIMTLKDKGNSLPKAIFTKTKLACEIISN